MLVYHVTCCQVIYLMMELSREDKLWAFLKNSRISIYSVSKRKNKFEGVSKNSERTIAQAEIGNSRDNTEFLFSATNIT